jgi:CheY-like chemotaxis protein
MVSIADNPINQTILSTFMKQKKIKYDVAKNGEEAVQKWKSGVFHLILVSFNEYRDNEFLKLCPLRWIFKCL